jgi:nucleoside permease NupC
MAREMVEEYVKQRMSGFSRAYTTVHSQLCCIATTKLVNYSPIDINQAYIVLSLISSVMPLISDLILFKIIISRRVRLASPHTNSPYILDVAKSDSPQRCDRRVKL